MPECAIDAPMEMSLQFQAHETRNTRSPLSMTDVIVPFAVMIPVNISISRQ
jgi:hypothetical protein